MHITRFQEQCFFLLFRISNEIALCIICDWEMKEGKPSVWKEKDGVMDEHVPWIQQ